LKFVKAYVDRHGKARHYFRQPGGKPVALPGLPGSDEFMAAYAAALANTPRTEVAARRTRAGSINAMVVGYLGSAAFAGLAPISKQQYRQILERMRKDYGDLSITMLKRKHVMRMLDTKAATPSAARDFLRCLRLLIKYALDISVIADDPTTGIRVKVKSDGYRSWTEDEITTFQNAYPLGTKQRLALELLLNTAARCADTVKLGRGHVRNGELQYVQQKTGRAVVITITAELAEAINAAAPSQHVVFLINERGRAYGAAGFSQMFVRWCREAGLKGLSAHGLRKAACRRMAEAGCTAPQIAAVSGHASLEEVQRYIDAADRAKLARAAMNKIRTATSSV
jgi:integrase